jgi:hypothetical protein
MGGERTKDTGNLWGKGRRIQETCGGKDEGYRKLVGERTKDTGEAFPEWTKFLFLFFAHTYIFPMNIPDQGI